MVPKKELALVWGRGHFAKSNGLAVSSSLLCTALSLTIAPSYVFGACPFTETKPKTAALPEALSDTLVMHLHVLPQLRDTNFCASSGHFTLMA